MVNKLNFEDKIKQELTTKAGEAEISEEMLFKIINRIENNNEGNRSMLKDKIQKMMMRKWIAASLCIVLIMGGVMFTFSGEVRAATLDVVNTIKTIFVLDKSQGEYKIVEKTSEDVIFTPVCSKTTKLSDEELSIKMGFEITFPKTLYGEYKLDNKAEAVGINKKVSLETSNQIQSNMFKAIDDEEAMNSLSQYNAYRYIFGTYINNDGNTIFIGVWPLDGPAAGDKSTAIETAVGGAKAFWIEEVYPNYRHIDENGVGQSDLYTKPNGIARKHILSWDVNGVRYHISTYQQLELTMEEAVKIAESFMSVQ